tara:strand:+ start:101 stop:364 length:264 start_codon:yes stop_codon:yes gene_type:complete
MFLLFGGDDYYPGGGMSDFRGRFDSIASAEEAARNVMFKNAWSDTGVCQWWQIVDADTLQVVQADREGPGGMTRLNEHIAKHVEMFQ